MAASSQVASVPAGPKFKSEQAKKAEAVKEIHQLKIKIQNLEKEKNTHVYSRLSDFRKEFSILQELDQKLTAERKTEKAKLVQQLNKVKNMVKKFQRELQDINPTPELVERLKVIMEDIESHISSFKEQQRHLYEELLREERLASQEVIALENKFDSWSQLAPAGVDHHGTKPTAPLASHRDVTRDLPPEVADFERFVQQTGGPRGGWDEYDHSTFFKYRNRHKGKPSFLQECVSYLPTRTEQEIKDHEAWYQEYLTRNEKKKEAIHRWKERKENEKAVAKEDMEDSEITEEEEVKRRELHRQQMLDRDRKERRTHLSAWRVEKELKKAEEEERKLREELHKARTQEEERKRQIQLRAQVEEYRQTKQMEEEERLAEQAFREQVEAQMKKQESSKAISKFRDRDLKAVKEKVAKEKQKEQEEIEKRKRLEQIRSQVKVERDPSRLLQPTKGWQERQKATESAGNGPMLHLPHRAVPTWRQGMF